MINKKYPCLKGIGIMSGSSMDGVDAVMVEVSTDSYTIISSRNFSFTDELRSRLGDAAGLRLKEYLVLEKAYSTFIAEKIQESFNEDSDFISIHGHTTHHVPSEGITHQMINGAVVSAITEHKVITDFRAGDICLSGVGTPLVPILEKNFFGDYDYYLNLGGIANITRATDWTAYDICPCNQLNNYVSRDTADGFDRDSQMAMRGSLDKELYRKLNAFSYYEQSSPKSLDNSWIRDQYFPILDGSRSMEDGLFTINRWVADKILENLAVAKSLFVTGGGAYNKQLISFLRDDIKGINVHLPSVETIEYKEALLMAYMGYLRLNNLPNILASATGAVKDTIGGAIYNVHGR